MSKRALITGGAGHIGKEIASILSKNGCELILVDKQEIKQNLSLKVDLANENCFSEIAEFVDKKWGQLDYLVNCAAFYDDAPGWGVPFEEETVEAWIKVLRVNTIAPFFLCQKLHPLLLKTSAPAIVNISSIYGLVAPDHSLYDQTDMTNPAAYAASKGGLQQITLWLSAVLAPKIRVNTVTPGGVERGQDKRFLSKYEKRTPLKRMASEKDIAHAVEFLLSERSGYITGHNLVVDGGWTAW